MARSHASKEQVIEKARRNVQAPSAQRTADAQQGNAEGLTRAQSTMLTAQQTIGNRAVLQRMVQREPGDDAPGADPAGAQSLSAGGNSVSVTPGGVSIQSSGPLQISAPTISMATAAVNSDAAITNNAGITKTSVIIADSVVASAYTPGAGNIQ